MGYYFRRISTTQERRMNAAIVDDYPDLHLVRGRRSFPMIPTVYDDIARSDVDNRSWKRHRRHQYRR